jgi:hypothetical protein
MSTIGILGCGSAGILVVLELLRLGIDPSRLLLVDEHFMGGDLATKWGSVRSNTRWVQITEALKDYPTAAAPIQTLTQQYKPDDIVPLSDLAWLMRIAIAPILPKVNMRTERCISVRQTDNNWTLIFASDTESVETLYLCQGGDPKVLDYGKPTIPLEVALDKSRLANMIRENQTCAVFGIAHSGTLVLRNLSELGVTTYGFYDGETPFLFARDGHYDGIKQESAEIADTILAGKLNGVSLVSFKNTKRLIQSLQRCDFIVCSIGFLTRSLQIQDQQGTSLSLNYSPATGLVYGTSLYGFGMAYPGETVVDGKVWKDISIPSFVNQIKRCLSVKYQV